MRIRRRSASVTGQMCVMSDVKNVVEVELDSSCVCVVYDEYGKEQASDDCFGCYSDALEDLEANVLEPWLDAHEADDGDYVVIDGSNIGWLRKSGKASLQIDKFGSNDFQSDLLDVLTFNGDFRLVFRLVGDDLSAIRYSHDEPMGASFVFRYVSANRVKEVI